MSEIEVRPLKCIDHFHRNLDAPCLPPQILHTVTVVSNVSGVLQSSQEKSRKSFVIIETGKRRALITKLWKKVSIDLVINQRIL